MNDERKNPKDSDIERAAEQRRRDLERPDNDPRPADTDVFNPVEGVAPHGSVDRDKR